MVTLLLPFPPSLNHYYRHNRGVTHISGDGRNYRSAVGISVAMADVRWSFTDGQRLSVAITAFPPDNRRRDLDNLLKCLLDALAKSEVYGDDSQIDKLTIERGEVVTQMALKTRIGVSIGLVNAMLKRGIRTGYVKARKAPFRRYAYCLSPKGFSEKSRLVAIYLENSLRFFRGARSQYADLFLHARTEGLSRLILVGSGELAEIAILAAWGQWLMLLGVLDPDKNLDQYYGVRVIRSLEEIVPFDAVVITDSRMPQKAYEAMRERLPEAQVLAPPLLKIARNYGPSIAATRQADQA